MFCRLLVEIFTLHFFYLIGSKFFKWEVILFTIYYLLFTIYFMHFVTTTFGEFPTPQHSLNKFGSVFGLTGNFGIARTSSALRSLLQSFPVYLAIWIFYHFTYME